MDPVHNELESLRALSSEITSTAAKLHPYDKTPRLGSLNDEPNDPVHLSSPFRFEASFPLTFDDGTQWVINFPLFSKTHPAYVPIKLSSEAATLSWVKA